MFLNHYFSRWKKAKTWVFCSVSRAYQHCYWNERMCDSCAFFFLYAWAHLQDHVLRGQKGNYLSISFGIKYLIISLGQDGTATVHMQNRTFITPVYFSENSWLFKYQDGLLVNTRSAGWKEKLKLNSLIESELNEG